MTAPVSSASPSPALLAASWCSWPGQAGVSWPMDKSRGHLPVDPPTVARLCASPPCRALCASPPRPGRRRACPARRVGGDVGHPHAAPSRALSPPGCTHCACGPVARVSARGQFFNRNRLLFYFEFISHSKFENSYLDIQSYKNYETSSIGFIIL
jgi:hypothetical protein